jgi:prevent-host-death family protein
VAKIVPFTEARASLTELLDLVEGLHEHVVITRNGRPAAVVISRDEWEALEETIGKRPVGRLEGFWSARVGNYRVICTIEATGVVVRTIRHRAIAYRRRRRRP